MFSYGYALVSVSEIWKRQQNAPQDSVGIKRVQVMKGKAWHDIEHEGTAAHKRRFG